MTLTQKNIQELWDIDFTIVDKLFKITGYTSAVSIYENANNTKYEHTPIQRDKLAATHDYLQSLSYPYYWRPANSSSMYYHPKAREAFISYVQMSNNR